MSADHSAPFAILLLPGGLEPAAIKMEGSALQLLWVAFDKGSKLTRQLLPKLVSRCRFVFCLSSDFFLPKSAMQQKAAKLFYLNFLTLPPIFFLFRHCSWVYVVTKAAA